LGELFDLRPQAITDALEYGGGPGKISINLILNTAKERLLQNVADYKSCRRYYAEANIRLQEVINKYSDQ